MKRRSFISSIVGALAALCTPVFGRPRVVDSMAGKREPEFLRWIYGPRSPQVRAAEPRPGDLVFFHDPDRVYRAPGDVTPVTRGSIVFWEWRPGRWYACAVKEREAWRGRDILTEIMPVSWGA